MTGENRVPERAIARLRPHGRVLVLPAIAVVAIAGATTFAAFMVDELWQQLAVLGAAVLAIGVLCLLPVLSWLSTQYLITTRRVVLRRGLFVRTRQEVLLSRSYDLTVRKAGLQAIFRSGDLLLNTGLDRPVVLRNVPRVDLLQRALSDVMQASTSSIATARRPVETTDPGLRRSRSTR